MSNEKHIKTYVDFLKRSIQIERPLKVVFDCSNGTTGLIIKRLFTHNSLLTTHYLNIVPDGNFPAHGPDPLKKSAIGNLRSAVLKHNADLGIIFDADGDRVFFIDNKGRFIDPDVIARLLIWQLKPKKIIIDVRTGWLIRKLTTHNSQLITSKVGHYFIKKLMRKIGADFGVERSGHYYFKIYNPSIFYTDSGILAAIEVINAVSKLPYGLADFVDLSPQYYRSGEINIKASGFNLATVEKHYKKTAKRISRLDGLTMEFNPPPLKGCNGKCFKGKLLSKGGGWWFNIRPSNTEPLIRLNIEAASPETLKKEKNKLTKIIGSAIN